jgi:hypothetical protein
MLRSILILEFFERGCDDLSVMGKAVLTFVVVLGLVAATAVFFAQRNRAAQSENAPATPQQILESTKAFAPKLMAELKKDELANRMQIAGLKTRSNDWQVVGVDVEKTQSLIDPVVGVIRISHYEFSSFESSTVNSSEISIFTIQVSQDGYLWKCNHAEKKTDSFESIKSVPVIDATLYITEIIEKMNKAEAKLH